MILNTQGKPKIAWDNGSSKYPVLSKGNEIQIKIEMAMYAR